MSRNAYTRANLSLTAKPVRPMTRDEMIELARIPFANKLERRWVALRHRWERLERELKTVAGEA